MRIGRFFTFRRHGRANFYLLGLTWFWRVGLGLGLGSLGFGITLLFNDNREWRLFR